MCVMYAKLSSLKCHNGDGKRRHHQLANISRIFFLEPSTNGTQREYYKNERKYSKNIGFGVGI